MAVEVNNLPAAPALIRIAAKVIPVLPAGRYYAAHLMSRRVPPVFLMHTPQELGGSLFACNLKDVIARDVCFTGRYEPQETSLIQRILKPGMSFVDVGANWGYFTLLGSHFVGETGRVISLEPDPRLFPVLQENIVRNRFHQAYAVNVAAADKEGRVKLAGYDEAGRNFGVSRLAARGVASAHLFDVRACTLDSLLQELNVGNVDLLKMDIEGAEGFAIDGLKKSLERGRVKRLLLELHSEQLAEHGQSAEQVIEQLQSSGYRAWVIDHSPKANRRAAYSQTPNLADLLKPLERRTVMTDWPHLLWAAPGVEMLA